MASGCLRVPVSYFLPVILSLIDTSGAGKGTLNMKVRWYGPDGQERWTELDVRPDPFLGNEVRLRDPTEPGAKPKVFTGVDIARLVAMVATNKYREAMLEKGKK